jgi:hypothetical protein
MEGENTWFPNVDQRKDKKKWDLDHLDLGTSSKIWDALSKNLEELETFWKFQNDRQTSAGGNHFLVTF